MSAMISAPAIHAENLKQAQLQIRAGQFADALDGLANVLQADPDHLEALYMSAVAARYLKKFDTALAFITRLKAVNPEFGRAYQEEGHLARDQGLQTQALSAYTRACQYNPALEASWTAQAKILISLGQPQPGAIAQAHADRLKDMPRHLVAVTNHLHEGRLFKAEDLCRTFLKSNPANTEAMRLLAEIGSRLGVLGDAEILLENAIEIESDNIQLRFDYIQVLRKQQKFIAALGEAEALYARDENNPLFVSHYAIECMQTGDFQKALSLFDKLLEKLPDDPITLTSRGHALKTAGRQDRAIASYRRAIANKPDHGDAWYALANLKTYTFSETELQAMQSEEAKPDLGHMARVHICFALGKAFEDRKSYDKAFTYYERGNRLRSANTRYTTEQMQTEFSAQKEICTASLFSAQANKGHPAPDPIFIVGLPRAGSTLIEQILASHSLVDGTLELPNILSLAHRLRGRKYLSERNNYPNILHDLPGEELEALGREYIDSTRIHRQSAPFFTDKMPNNFRHLGLIHLILPNAKIIDARRHPMDCCWSGFKQLFAEGQEFTYALDDIGRYYKAYVDLMDHWEQVLPAGRILRVQHEDVLGDLEGQVRRLLGHCGLPFEQACLDFHKTDRAVRTASSEQVRKPINRAGQDQWRPYETHLDPLKNALGINQASGG